MPRHGGKRAGAGRRAGSKNRATRLREQAERAQQEHAKKGGVAPLDYMLAMLRDPKAKKRDKQWAAKEAAPYVHHRLASIDTKVKGALTVNRKVMTFSDG